MLLNCTTGSTPKFGVGIAMILLFEISKDLKWEPLTGLTLKRAPKVIFSEDDGWRKFIRTFEIFSVALARSPVRRGAKDILLSVRFCESWRPSMMIEVKIVVEKTVDDV